MKVHIIGLPSAGKTTLADGLAAHLGAPVHHLDHVAFVDDQWTPRPLQEREAMVSTFTGEPFDLLVSDAALPGLSGDRLAREVARVRPSLIDRILLTTGDWVSREPEAVARRLGAGLLRKPFELEELRRIVRTRLQRTAEH